MKFLCLAYEEEKTLDELSRSEWDALRRETLAYVEILRRSGHLIHTSGRSRRCCARSGATARPPPGRRPTPPPSSP
jgi:hypothetical protein